MLIACGTRQILKNVTLLNTAKTQIFHPVYILKISKFGTISSAGQPAKQQPAVTLSSTSAMAPDFLHKKR